MVYLKEIASSNRSGKDTSLNIHALPHVNLDGAVSDCTVSAPEMFDAGDTKIDMSTVDAVSVASALAWDIVR